MEPNDRNIEIQVYNEKKREYIVNKLNAEFQSIKGVLRHVVEISPGKDLYAVAFYKNPSQLRTSSFVWTEGYKDNAVKFETFIKEEIFAEWVQATNAQPQEEKKK